MYRLRKYEFQITQSSYSSQVIFSPSIYVDILTLFIYCVANKIWSFDFWLSALTFLIIHLKILDFWTSITKAIFFLFSIDTIRCLRNSEIVVCRVGWSQGTWEPDSHKILRSYANFDCKSRHLSWKSDTPKRRPKLHKKTILRHKKIVLVAEKILFVHIGWISIARGG